MPSDQPRPALPTDRWWTPDDLAAYMGYSAKTIRKWASQKATHLPPRIRATSELRWEPSVCIDWSKRNSCDAANDEPPPPPEPVPQPAPPPRTRGGRPRLR